VQGSSGLRVVDEGLRVESTLKPSPTLNPVEGSGMRVHGKMVGGWGLRVEGVGFRNHGRGKREEGRGKRLMVES
jgi:hypothetical protein